MSRTVVVTGASGMLGSAVYRYLRRKGVPVEGWTKSYARTPLGEILHVEPDANPKFLTDRVGTVIHCAAATDADWCEAHVSEAEKTNSSWPESLAVRAWELGIRFVYVSTDAVYDGTKPGRLSREEDPPRPLSVYAKTKLSGEQRVLYRNPAAVVIRTTMVGWTAAGRREKFAEEIARALLTNRPINLWWDAVFSPLHVSQLAELLVRVANTHYAGILNLGASDSVSKSDFGKSLAYHLRASASLIGEKSVDGIQLSAPRTKNTALDVSRARGLLAPRGGHFPSTYETITQLAEEVRNGTVERIKGGPWPDS